MFFKTEFEFIHTWSFLLGWIGSSKKGKITIGNSKPLDLWIVKSLIEFTESKFGITKFVWFKFQYSTKELKSDLSDLL